jgi:hypothetical protein
MLKKLVKWGKKVWCVADSISKYVCNFYIYTSAPKGGKVARNLMEFTKAHSHLTFLLERAKLLDSRNVVKSRVVARFTPN